MQTETLTLILALVLIGTYVYRLIGPTPPSASPKPIPPPPEYYVVAKLLFDAMSELASILSIKQVKSANRLKPARLRNVHRKESNGDLIFFYEMLRVGHAQKNERIAAEQLQMLIDQMLLEQTHELKGKVRVAHFRYNDYAAQVTIRYIPSKANNTIY